MGYCQRCKRATPQNTKNRDYEFIVTVSQLFEALNMADVPIQVMKGDIYNVYVPSLLLLMLCIIGRAVASSNHRARLFFDALCPRWS
jgi:hypothetical protein